MPSTGSGGQQLAGVGGLEAGGLALGTQGWGVLVTPGPGQGQVPDPPQLKEGGRGAGRTGVVQGTQV